jgi:hypothetical protein
VITMRTVPTPASPVVIRLDPRARLWQSSARVSADRAPDSVRALLAGRNRLELSAQEAEAAIEWARHVPGFEIDGTPALAVSGRGASRARMDR